MLPFRFLFLSLLLLFSTSSGFLIAEPVEAGGPSDTKVATILPSHIIPISSCNSHQVFPSQEHGGVWLKPSLEGPRNRPQCVSNGLINRVNETALYGKFATTLLIKQLIRRNIKSVSRFHQTMRAIVNLNSTYLPRVNGSNGGLEVPEL